MIALCPVCSGVDDLIITRGIDPVFREMVERYLRAKKAEERE